MSTPSLTNKTWGIDNSFMGKQFESTFPGYNEDEIFYQCWLEEKPNGTIVLVHGIAEHSDCYSDFAAELNSAGWNVYALDLRGHGKSPGKRGYIKDFSDYTRDLKSFISFVKSERPEDKLVLFGHSMGGLVSLLTYFNYKPKGLSGIVLSSPALGYAIEVPAFKDKLARISDKWFPKLTLYNEIQYQDLTHDQERIAGYERDSLRHDKICAAIYLGMTAGMERAHSKAGSLDMPFLLQLAGRDKIVSTPDSKKFFEKVKSVHKSCEIYADSYHEIYNDIERDHCFKDLKAFLRELK